MNFNRRIYGRTAALILTAIIIAPSPIMAISGDTQREVMLERGIPYYNIEECTTSDTSSGNISPSDAADWGDDGQTATNAKKIYIYLISNAFAGNGDKAMNAIQAAAVLGNFYAESAFNPSADSGTGYRGIAQWNSGRYSGINDPKTSLDNQLEYVRQEMNSEPYKTALEELWSAQSESDLEKATYAVTRNYEIAINGSGGSTKWTSEADAIANVQHFMKRYEGAKRAYEKYKDLAPETAEDSGSSCTSQSNPNIEGYVFPFGVGTGQTKQSDLTSWYGTEAPSTGPTIQGGDLCHKTWADKGHCHHGTEPDGAIDLTVRDSYNKGTSYIPQGEQYYAIYSGTIDSISQRNGNAKCYDVMLRGDDGWIYWYGHGSNWANDNLKVGQTVTAGQKINEMGIAACADNTAPHEHIDRGYPKGTSGGIEGHRDTDMPSLMNKLFKTLPE